MKKTNNKMKSTFLVSKIDNINLKKYGLNLKNYKISVKKILNILFLLNEIKTSRIFSRDISKIRFDISFCSDTTIQRINKTYRNKDKATDVITFSLFADDVNAIVCGKTADLGQIIISCETLDKQKDENNTTFNEELITLTTHGILHLFGFDHLEKKGYDFVVRIQNLVLKIFKEENE